MTRSGEPGLVSLQVGVPLVPLVSAVSATVLLAGWAWTAVRF
jgi:hypothetical protein